VEDDRLLWEKALEVLSDKEAAADGSAVRGNFPPTTRWSGSSIPMIAVYEKYIAITRLVVIPAAYRFVLTNSIL
jgi:hypothetical protein